MESTKETILSEIRELLSKAGTSNAKVIESLLREYCAQLETVNSFTATNDQHLLFRHRERELGSVRDYLDFEMTNDSASTRYPCGMLRRGEWSGVHASESILDGKDIEIARLKQELQRTTCLYMRNRTELIAVNKDRELQRQKLEHEAKDLIERAEAKQEMFQKQQCHWEEINKQLKRDNAQLEADVKCLKGELGYAYEQLQRVTAFYTAAQFQGKDMASSQKIKCFDRPQMCECYCRMADINKSLENENEILKTNNKMVLRNYDILKDHWERMQSEREHDTNQLTNGSTTKRVRSTQQGNGSESPESQTKRRRYGDVESDYDDSIIWGTEATKTATNLSHTDEI